MNALDRLVPLAHAICAQGYKERRSYWWIARRLVDIGIPAHRAKRMARHATKGMFMWEGIRTPLDR